MAQRGTLRVAVVLAATLVAASSVPAAAQEADTSEAQDRWRARYEAHVAAEAERDAGGPVERYLQLETADMRAQRVRYRRTRRLRAMAWVWAGVSVSMFALFARAALDPCRGCESIADLQGPSIAGGITGGLALLLFIAGYTRDRPPEEVRRRWVVGFGPLVR